jgi:ribosomal-protein-alanine N-acetyltransferase|tara:strand:- start:14389 stop:14967 length:579 start_codon:yes stop_codon:yes gene_type:complete
MEIKKAKYRNAIISDSNELSKLESNIFVLDKVNTNFYKEINKESKKIFICSYENEKNIHIYSKIKNSILKKITNEKYINTTENKIIGYIKIWNIIEESHIEQIGVINNFRQQGIGEKLLLLSIKYCKDNGSKKILLECRKSNTSAIYLYKKYMFKITSVRKNYYPLKNTREDAICFESPDITTDFYYNKYLK